jgi:DNA repair protein RecO (recombination protein O)
MWHSTRGIVFHTVRYSDSSIIAKIYTELFGLQSYLVRGVFKQGSKTRPALFQPLTLLQMEVGHRSHDSLQRYRDIHVAVPCPSTASDIRKSSIALFINELVFKSIREEEANPEMFGFLWKQCLELDALEKGFALFHIRFTFNLMHLLGIFPQLDDSSDCQIFNLRDGLFQHTIPDHPDYLDPEQGQLFLNFALAESTSQAMMAGYRQRHQVLEILMHYYRLHLPGFKGVESLDVLKEVFGD